MRRTWRLWAAMIGLAAGPARAGSSGESTMARQVLAIYQPWHCDQAALAPDGARVAFVENTHRGLVVTMRDTAFRGKPIRVDVERRSLRPPSCFEWADDQWLIVGTETTLVALSGDGAVVKLLSAERSGRGPPNRIRVLRILGGPATVVAQQTLPLQIGGQTTEVYRIDAATAQRRTILTLGEDEARDPLLVDRQGNVRLRLSREGTPQRYLYQPANGGGKWSRLDRMVNDKALAHFQIAPKDFIGHRAFPVDFGYDPNQLYFASNLGRDTYGLYLLDLSTGRRMGFAVEDDTVDLIGPDAGPAQLVFDRARRALAGLRTAGPVPATRWLDPELRAVQSELEAKFPERTVEIREWDAGRQRFLALISSTDDPGRYFLYERADGACVDFGRRGGVDPQEANPTELYTFDRPNGIRLSGDITMPRVRPLAKPALVIWLHDGPWEHLTLGYSREAQALATMGFAVTRVNYSGSSGAGARLRQAIQPSPDAVPAADLTALLAWLAPRYDFDAHRVALIGEGFGGYIALRAAQMNAGVFRGVVAINAPLDIATLEYGNSDEWARTAAEQSFARSTAAAENVQLPSGNLAEEAGTGDAPLDAMARFQPRQASGEFEREVARAIFGPHGGAVSNHLGELTAPVMLMYNPGTDARRSESFARLFRTLQRQDHGSEMLQLPPQSGTDDLATRASTVWRMGGFLNLHVYDFRVKLGELTERE